MVGGLATTGISQVMSPNADMAETNKLAVAVATSQEDNSVPVHKRVQNVSLQYGPDFPTGRAPAASAQRSDYGPGMDNSHHESGSPSVSVLDKVVNMASSGLRIFGAGNASPGYYVEVPVPDDVSTPRRKRDQGAL